MGGTTSTFNNNNYNVSNDNVSTCSDLGLILPVLPEEGWKRGLRAALYLAAMLWCFFGVAIVADYFMCGIDTITSRTRKIQVSDPGSQGTKTVSFKFWNDTVANLTLLAFGTSAPEIMLSVYDTLIHGFTLGDLGPGTIVGSAAFNQFIITPICILSIPATEERRLKNLRVFGVTGFMGIFAYAWVLVVLMVTSPQEVELWEASVTLLMFPLLIVMAYWADRGCCCPSSKTAPEQVNRIDVEGANDTGSADIVDVAKKLNKEQKLSEEETAKVIASRLANDRPRGAGWYRVSVTREMTAGQRITPKQLESIPTQSTLSPGDLEPGQSLDKAVVEFTAASCAVLESEGYVRLGVRRYGNMKKEVKVGIETIEGTAKAVEDFVPLKDLLTFKPGERHQEVFIEIVDDDVWEPDEIFYVRLFHDSSRGGSPEDDLVLGRVKLTHITIVNDDEPGRLEFSKPSYLVKESAERALLTIRRVNGADGQVVVSWRTRDLSARDGQHYVGASGRVVFKHGETSKDIAVGILQIQELAQEPTFKVTLSSSTEGAQIGKLASTIVTIIKDREFNSLVSRIKARTERGMSGLQLATMSWGQQVRAAMNVNGGDLQTATRLDYFLHFVTFFWKVLFATTVPPTSIWGGWATFLVALAWIAVMTAIIADLATILGCLLSLAAIVTATTVVSLGTSMPDTFASRVAALNERWADSAIGNINGSNAVNVYLGLGLPWFLCAVRAKVKGERVTVNTEALGLSVAIFVVCAFLTVIILMLRRNLAIFGRAELGGPTLPKRVTSAVIASFWVIYVIMSILQAQKIINVGF